MLSVYKENYEYLQHDGNKGFFFFLNSRTVFSETEEQNPWWQTINIGCSLKEGDREEKEKAMSFELR